MAILVAATSTAESTSAASLACNVPTGTTAGDVLVATVVGPTATAATAVPTGWTLAKSQSGTDGNNGQAAYVRVATASEPASYTFVSTGAVNRMSVIMARVTGVDTSTPQDVAAVSATSITGTAVTDPSIATVTAGAVLLHFIGLNASSNNASFSTITPPSGSSNTVETTTTGSGGTALVGRKTWLHSEPRPTAGATGARTWTLPSPIQATLITVALRPLTAATPKTYYVAANGSDTANGLSTATPFATISKVNGLALNPGDSVLFRGGDTFTGEVYVGSGGLASGTAANPVTFGSYGTGRATITNSTGHGFNVYNAAGLVFKDLILAGTGTAFTNKSGISLYKDSAGRADYVQISNVESYGWQFGVSVGGTTGGIGFSNVTATGCVFRNNRDDGFISYGPSTFAGAYSHSSISVVGCSAYDNEGNSANTASHSGSGVILGSVDGGLIDQCVAYSNGSLNGAASMGPVGLWAYDANAMVISRSLSYDNHSGTAADGGGFDLDMNVSNSRIEYCLAYNNDGAGILLFGDTGNTNHTGNVVRYNLLWGNGRSAGNYGDITFYGNVRSSSVYGNTVVSVTNGTVQPSPIWITAGTPSGNTVRNNIFQARSTASVVKTTTALASTAVLFQGNAYHSTGTLGFTWGGSTYATLAAWRAAAANQELVSGTASGYVGDPGLTSVATAPTVTDPANLAQATGFQLVGTSPVAQSGLDLPTLFSTSIGTRDYYGGALTAPYAVGAHEVVPAAVFSGALGLTGSGTLVLSGVKNPGPAFSGTVTLSSSGSLALSGVATITPVTPTLTHRVVGIPSSTTGRVSVRTSNATSVRLKVGTDSAVTAGVVYGPSVTPDSQGNAQLTVSGLTAGTKYYYRVAMVDSGGVEVLDAATTVGTFKSAPVGQTSFAFNFGSCTNATDSASLAAIAARGDDLFFHLGDLYYADASGTGLQNIRDKMAAKIQAPNHAAVFATTPTTYTPSDHDGMNNNTAAGSDATAWTNWNAAYRELFPTPTLPGGATGAHYTFTWGRVRFIQLDTRSFSSDPALTDNASKTHLGATQKQWLKDTITAATEPVIVILQADPWTGTAVGDDGWAGFTTERTELANFFTASGKQIVMLAGDMHAVAADNGTNTAGGIYLFHAAPFNNAASQKYTPYTQGPYPATGTATVQQYGRVAVTDSGSSIALAFTGYSSDNTARATLTKTVSTVPAYTGSLALSSSGSLSLSGTASQSQGASGSLTLAGSGSLTLSGKPAPSGSLALSGSGSLSLGPRITASGSLSLSGSGALVLQPGKKGSLSLSSSGSLALSGAPSLIVVYRADEGIWVGEAAGVVRAFNPGDIVPDSAVASLHVADRVSIAVIRP